MLRSGLWWLGEGPQREAQPAQPSYSMDNSAVKRTVNNILSHLQLSWILGQEKIKTDPIIEKNNICGNFKSTIISPYQFSVSLTGRLYRRRGRIVREP